MFRHHTVAPYLPLLALLAFLAPAFRLAHAADANSADKAETAKADRSDKPNKLYELRIYTCNEGKLPDLHARFRDHTMRLFEKHGIENIIYWTISEGAPGDDVKNTLVYIIAHKDRAAADASWAAFHADPEWQAVQKKSEENGKILAKPPVSIFMKPTDFCPPDEKPNGKSDAPPRIFELRKYNTGESGLPGTVDRFKAGEKDLFTKNGMTTVSFWTAADNSAFIYLLAHKDRETARKSWQGFMTDFRQFTTDYNARRGGQPAPGGPAAQGAGRGGRGGRGGNEIRFLVPTDYSPRK